MRAGLRQQRGQSPLTAGPKGSAGRRTRHQRSSTGRGGRSRERLRHGNVTNKPRWLPSIGLGVPAGGRRALMRMPVQLSRAPRQLESLKRQLEWLKRPLPLAITLLVAAAVGLGGTTLAGAFSGSGLPGLVGSGHARDTTTPLPAVSPKLTPANTASGVRPGAHA